MICGTQSSGQGHETVFAQVAADLLDVPLESVRLVTGDSREVEKGGGTHSARSMRLVGTLLVEACEKIIAKARGLAAEAFAAPETDVKLCGRLLHRAALEPGLQPVRPRGPQRARDAVRHGRAFPPHSGPSDRLRGVRARGRSADRRGGDQALHLGGRRRAADQSHAGRRPDAWRHRPGHRPGAVGGGGDRSRAAGRSSTPRSWTTGCRGPTTFRASTWSSRSIRPPAIRSASRAAAKAASRRRRPR